MNSLAPKAEFVKKEFPSQCAQMYDLLKKLMSKQLKEGIKMMVILVNKDRSLRWDEVPKPTIKCWQSSFERQIGVRI